jgi:hypothetical protein
VIPLSAAAEAALDGLTAHYTALGRDRAIDRLIESLQTACARFEARRGLFLDAPRPYPSLGDLGFRWTKQGPYWVAFQETDAGPVVAGVFYETADIPNRL